MLKKSRKMRIYRLLVWRNALETNSNVESYLVPIQIGNAPSVEKSPNCSKDEVGIRLFWWSSVIPAHSGPAYKDWVKYSKLAKIDRWTKNWTKIDKNRPKSTQIDQN